MDNTTQPSVLMNRAEGDPREISEEGTLLATRSHLPLVAQRSPARDIAVLLGGFAFIGFIGAVTFSNLNDTRNPVANPTTQVAKAGSEIKGPEVAPPVPAAAITPPPAEPGANGVPLPAAADATGQTPAQLPPVNANGSATVLFDASALPLPAIGDKTAGGPAAASPNNTNPNDDFASRISDTTGGKAVATAGMDPKTTVTQGTLIPAVLETAINTDVPGYVRAVVSADVRSFDGTRVLIPRSSRLIGQYRSGLQAGQKRAYVIWTRLIRPDGVSVNIGSPAVGFSGETGLDGKVQTHFFERFGSAMLLSVIGGLSTLGGNSGVVIANSGQSAAAAAIGQTAQIGPTVRVRLGAPIRVFTARDLDFSKVPTE
ncbi:MAG: hypothetical protein RL145_399 [Pseudomonadota bacterium]|jgi:type IV secretion system protein VirB10